MTGAGDWILRNSLSETCLMMCRSTSAISLLFSMQFYPHYLITMTTHIDRCGEWLKGNVGGGQESHTHQVERGKGIPKQREIDRRREVCEWEGCMGTWPRLDHVTIYHQRWSCIAQQVMRSKRTLFNTRPHSKSQSKFISQPKNIFFCD